MKIDLNDPFQRQAGMTLLRAAVQRVIFCPYTQAVLDVRTAILLDSDIPGKAPIIMAGNAYDVIKDAPEVAETLAGYDVIDGRELHKGDPIDLSEL